MVYNIYLEFEILDYKSLATYIVLLLGARFYKGCRQIGSLLGYIKNTKILSYLSRRWTLCYVILQWAGVGVCGV